MERKAQHEQKKYINTHTIQNVKMYNHRSSCIVRFLCWNHLILFIRSLYNMLHFTLWMHLYLCNISWIIIIAVRETFTTQCQKCWEGNRLNNYQNVNLVHFHWKHTLWMRHENVLYLLSIKTLSFMQTGTKVKVNSDIQKDYKSKHIQITTLQRCAHINNYLSFFISQLPLCNSAIELNCILFKWEYHRIIYSM